MFCYKDQRLRNSLLVSWKTGKPLWIRIWSLLLFNLTLHKGFIMLNDVTILIVMILIKIKQRFKKITVRKFIYNWIPKLRNVSVHNFALARGHNLTCTFFVFKVYKISSKGELKQRKAKAAFINIKLHLLEIFLF